MPLHTTLGATNNLGIGCAWRDRSEEEVDLLSQLRASYTPPSSFGEAWSRAQTIRLEHIYKMFEASPDALRLCCWEGKGWSREQITAAIRGYQRYLTLVMLYPDYNFVPSKVVDEVVHFHLLHVPNFDEDCMRLFGRTLLHDPKYGMNQPDPKEVESSIVTLVDRIFNQHVQYIIQATADPPSLTDLEYFVINVRATLHRMLPTGTLADLHATYKRTLALLKKHFGVEYFEDVSPFDPVFSECSPCRTYLYEDGKP
mgnify:CR=1 FL=1